MRTDGKADPYIHGEPWDAGPSIGLEYDPEFIKRATDNVKRIERTDADDVLLSEEDVEKKITVGTD